MTKVVHLYASQRVSRRAKDGSDGTSVTIVSKSVTYQISASGTDTPTGNWSDKVVATTDTKPYLWTRTIVVYSDTNSTTSYSVSYKGKDGAAGKDAININLSPPELVYNADKDGNISSTQFNGNLCTVSATRGSKQEQISISVIATDNCVAYLNGTTIKLTKITTESVGTGKYVPASAGGVKLKVIVDGTDYYAYLPFRVNTNTFVKTLIETDETFQRKYTEISNKYNTVSNELNDKASKDELREVSSSIEQTARRISLEVSSNAVGRRNLLVNSDFHNQESVRFTAGARIECTTGKDGINCFSAIGTYSGSGEGNYIGAFWDGSQPDTSRSIKIQKGKKYVVSCWVKCNNTNALSCIECIYTDKQQGASRLDTAFRETFFVSQVNTWELHTLVIDTTNAPSEYIAVNFWMNPKLAGYGVNVSAYFCKPMFEQREEYSGWSLSVEDYDYVGGNLLDNTTKLIASDNLVTANGISFNDYEGTYSVSHANQSGSGYTDMLRWELSKGGSNPVKQGKDYILSFLAKGKGQITCYLYKDGTPSIMVESVGSPPKTNVDGEQTVTVSSDWKRYWVHFHIIGSSLPAYVLFRVFSGNEIYISKPKLEEGALMTEYTERKTDLVDKASLKKAGIGITDKEVLLYGEQVKVMNNNAIAALFKDGMLNADLIAAKVLESLGSNGARVVINDGIMEFFGSINKTQPNIRFGLNSEGSAVLSYYDNAGNFLYDLGPDGISTMDKQDGIFTEYSFYTSQNLFGITSIPSSYGTMKTFKSSQGTVSETFYVANEAYDSHLFPKLNPSRATVTHLYRYHAPRINGKIVADSKNGLTTQELASKADGKYFTSNRNVVFNGNLTNLAVGDFWNIDSAVTNMGNFVSALLKYGESYTKPTYSRSQQMTLIDGSSELGIVSRICSLETTTQYGVNIHAGWE